MLTVNIQYPGTQITIEAKSVEAGSQNSGLRYDTVTLTKPDNELYILNDGMIYVMNEAGSTVAKYNLSRDTIEGQKVTFAAGQPAHA